MKSLPPHRIAAILTLGCALLPGQAAWCLKGQEDASATAILLSRARTLEQRGRLDLAKQDWSQVLLADPDEAEALAGLVRAARAEGHAAEADKYLAKLRAAHPNSPELGRLQSGSKGQDTATLLDEAAKLARAGDLRGAMAVYRRVYGMSPPPGGPALAYYETEAGTEDGRAHAIAGLRALVDRFPGEARYRVALGRVLLGSARTRAEGRTILGDMPGDPEAVAALRSAGANGAGRTTEIAAGAAAAPRSGGGTGESRGQTAEVQRSPEPKVNSVAERKPAAAESPSRTAGRPAADLAASARATHALPSRNGQEGSAAPGRHLTYVADEQAAFNALNQHRTAEADQLFREILSKDPNDARALAGMGYLRVSMGDLRAAVMFFEQAQEHGDRSLALTRAMVNAQFEYALKQAGTERAKGALPAAEGQYRAALSERPSDPEALEGLGGTLLQEWRPGDAIPVYEKLTRVRPMDPAAWRGLVVAQASAGRGAAALSTDAGAPPGVKSPLAKDQTYQRALSVARGSQETQVARAEPPPPPPPRPAAQPPAPVPAAIAVQPVPGPSTAVAAASLGEVPAKLPTTVAKAAPAAPPAPVEGSRANPVASESVPRAGDAPRAGGASNAEELQQAEVALLHGRNAEAATMFRALAGRTPERAEGWRGLVLALHNGGREAEAAAVLEQIPSGARVVLDRDASFQTAAGGVFLANNQPNEALRALARAQDVFSSQRLPAPVELVLNTARLLAARGDDENLYRELMYLGERTDLTDTRRVEVQMIWTRWAVRRARALEAAGDDGRAVTLLNAAAGAFPGNPEVVRAVADGYAGIGKPREAVALYKNEDLTAAPAAAVEAAVSAATAAHDFRTAESWTRLGLHRFGNDPQMLNAAAELAQARGREKRAVELSQQAKGLAPAQDPGQVLVTELKEAKAGQGWADRTSSGGQLGVLLAPGDAVGAQAAKPYLPAAAASGTTGSYPPATTMTEPPVLTGYDEPSR